MSEPVRNLHHHRRLNLLTLPTPLQPFQVIHGPIKLPLQCHLITQEFVQHLFRRHYRGHLLRLLLRNLPLHIP